MRRYLIWGGLGVFVALVLGYVVEVQKVTGKPFSEWLLETVGWNSGWFELGVPSAPFWAASGLALGLLIAALRRQQEPKQ